MRIHELVEEAVEYIAFDGVLGKCATCGSNADFLDPASSGGGPPFCLVRCQLVSFNLGDISLVLRAQRH